MSSKVISNTSPFEKLFHKKPDYSALRVFGCLCFLFTRRYNKHKLQFRSIKATFLGYSSSHKRYKALLPDGKLIITRDIVFDFDESVSLFKMLLLHSPKLLIFLSHVITHHLFPYHLFLLIITYLSLLQIPKSSHHHLVLLILFQNLLLISFIQTLKCKVKMHSPLINLILILLQTLQLPPISPSIP